MTGHGIDIAPLIQRGFAVIKLPDLAAASITTIARDNPDFNRLRTGNAALGVGYPWIVRKSAGHFHEFAASIVRFQQGK